jgi:hypothetical protein
MVTLFGLNPFGFLLQDNNPHKPSLTPFCSSGLISSRYRARPTKNAMMSVSTFVVAGDYSHVGYKETPQGRITLTM